MPAAARFGGWDIGSLAFNLPKRIRGLRVFGEQDVYLPVYLIACADQRLLVYSGVIGERDTFIEQSAPSYR